MMSNIFFLHYNNTCFVPTALIFLLLMYNGLKSAVSIFIELIGSTNVGLNLSYDIIT